ncbi:MAG: hypothetical protein ACYCU0_07550 [Solirubrobacteraceae bacterium]
MTLLAVPNVSEGRDAATIAAISDAFVAAGALLLDVHSDSDHQRSVYTLAGGPGELAYALLAGIEVALERVDISDGRGAHPHVGAVDVAPIVFVHERDRGAAAAEALLLSDLLGERCELPVLLYGALARGRTRAELRRRGAAALASRIDAGELRPDFGPARLEPRHGATLVAARPPLVAFNVELAPPAGTAEARAIAARVREGGADGLRGVRAIGVELAASRRTATAALGVHLGTSDASSSPPAGEALGVHLETSQDEAPGVHLETPSGEALGVHLETSQAPGSQRRGDVVPRSLTASAGSQGADAPKGGQASVGQVSMNVEDPIATPLAAVLAAVEAVAAEHGACVAVAELVGLAPRAALTGFPERMPLVGFDAERHVIENAIAAAQRSSTG